MDCIPTVLCPWNFPAESTGVGCHSLLQGIFPNQGSNLGLSHCRWILYNLSLRKAESWTQICLISRTVHLSLKLHCLHPTPPPPNLQPSTQDFKRMGSPVFYLLYHSSCIGLLHRGTEVFPLIPPDSLSKPTSPRPSPPFLLPSHSGFFSFLGAPVEFRDRVRLLDPHRLPSLYCVCLLLLLQLMSSGKLTVAGSCAIEKSSTPYGHFYIFRQLWSRGLGTWLQLHSE